MTERELLDRLHRRYSQVNPSNGPRYVIAEHVRSDAGFFAGRTLDAIVQDLWPSSGLPLHGFEIKCSRADWLRERADPSKAQAFRPYLDFFWLIIADHKVARPEELPDGWGLTVATGDTLRAVRMAKRLDPEPMPKGMRAALLRSAAKTARNRMATQSDLPLFELVTA